MIAEELNEESKDSQSAQVTNDPAVSSKTQKQTLDTS